MFALLRIWWLIFLQVLMTPMKNRTDLLSSGADQDLFASNGDCVSQRWFDSVKLKVERAQLIVDGADWCLI
jgi:hypothetical protein